MRTRTLFPGACLLLFATLGSPGIFGTPPPLAAPATAGAPDPGAAAAPRVALLATAPGALHTTLYHSSAAGDLSAPLATFTHPQDAVVRGAAVPGTDVVIAAADTAETRDLSFAASLFRLAPHAPPVRLCDGVVHASRPLVTSTGRILVARGAAGPALPFDGTLEPMRVDALSIDEVDPWTGDLRTVHTLSGHLAFLAGSLGDEVIVYRVSPAGADIVAVGVDTGAVRVIVPHLPPFARDFSVDPERGALVFQGRHETDTRTWTIERADLGGGPLARLHESRSMSLIPRALPGGRVAYNPGDGTGLALLGGGALTRTTSAADWVLSLSGDGRWAAGLRTSPGALPAPFVLDVEQRRSFPIPSPPGARVDVAGLVSAGGAP